jgi:hypothetical protein
MNKAKPEIITFFNIPYEIYCGACGRRIATAGKYYLFEDIKQNKKACQWCGTEVDWNEQSKEVVV